MAERVARVTHWAIAVTLVFTLAATGRADVTLLLDGERLAVSTRANTVAGVLSEQEIDVAAHDRVFPPASTPVRDGLEIRVVRSHRIVIELNGAVHVVWTTGDTVGDVLRELGLDPDLVQPSRGARIERGTRLVLRDAVEVTVVHDGLEATVLSTAVDVAGLLSDLGVGLDADDEVTPPLDASVEGGARVVVVRVERHEVADERAVAYATQRRDDPALPRGQERVVQEGRAGLERVTYAVVERDGAVAERVVVARQVVRAPVARIVAVGTRPPYTQAGRASWYDAQPGACAHRTLPFGTRVTVTAVATGNTAVCTVADRGPYVDERVIDLDDAVFSQLAPLSRGVIDVQISW